ncbi:hypothetical protein ACFQO7_26365 [Catellatospora aurea]|uniref:Rv3651-like N-terminal domain-containing protein n=1 Tax=Catellatospora aurea TaxID=1337874 RepID=A0ABW2H2B7_9ACTN
MKDGVLLGEITSPSGELVLMDGGYLGLWSGSRSPEEMRQPDEPSAVDFEVVGQDAEVAARSFDRQAGRALYDIPQHAAAQMVELFESHCRRHGLQAELRAFGRQLPHRERARRAIAAGDPGFVITGVPVISIGGLPTDRPLPVMAVPSGQGDWARIRIVVGNEPGTSAHSLGRIGVDWARFVFADADALSAWVHDDSVDGLADVVFWGLHESEVAAEFGVTRTGTPGDDHFGWLNLPVADAYAKAIALDRRRTAAPDRRFVFDFRPHSHHWQVMAGVRASEHEAATIDVGGARIMFAMTSVGDGFFPVQLERDGVGAHVAIDIGIQGDEGST